MSKAKEFLSVIEYHKDGELTSKGNLKDGKKVIAKREIPKYDIKVGDRGLLYFNPGYGFYVICNNSSINYYSGVRKIERVLKDWDYE